MPAGVLVLRGWTGVARFLLLYDKDFWPATIPQRTSLRHLNAAGRQGPCYHPGCDILSKDAKKGDKTSPKIKARPGDLPGSGQGGPERGPEARRLAELIEDERRRLGEVPEGKLTSPEVVRRLARLEELINEYIRLVRR